MANPRVVSNCPACAGKLEVRELGCAECGITVRGEFEGCEFCSLPEDQLRFLRLFVSRRGNLREVERELGLSYPTVRSRLDGLLQALGYPTEMPSARDRQEQRRQVIEDLKAGSISAEEATKRLRA